jgi:hypothetical protein
MGGHGMSDQATKTDKSAHAASMASTASHANEPSPGVIELERERLALERNRLQFDRQKLAMEFRLKHRELADHHGRNWKELIANPLTLAIAGGFITLMTTIVSNVFTVRATVAGAAQTLQADLIKKFVESPKTETVRDNLRFLIEAGLLPQYEEKIGVYLKNHPYAAPQVGGSGIDSGTKTIDPTYFVAGMAINSDGDCGAACNAFAAEHSNTTSLMHPDTHRPLDPTVIPFIALPIGQTRDSQISLGDIYAAYNTKNKKMAFAIFGDLGPRNRLGEGSIALARKLGIPAESPSGGTSEGIIYIGFPKSRINSHISPELIEAEGKKLFEIWGGDKELLRRLQSAS